jgi:hypothetical protein
MIGQEKCKIIHGKKLGQYYKMPKNPLNIVGSLFVLKLEGI